MPASPHSDAAREYAHRAHYYLADRGSGHLVVFLHGLGGDNQQPLGLLDQFTKPKAVERAIRLDTVPGNVSIDWDGRLTVECPITVVAAARDPGHPEYVAELWRDRIAGTDLVRVPSRDDDPAGYSQALEETVIASVRAWASQ